MYILIISQLENRGHGYRTTLFTHTVHVFKNDALRKPFPLLHRDCTANAAPVYISAATEVLNAAPEDTNAAHEKP